MFVMLLSLHNRYTSQILPEYLDIYSDISKNGIHLWKNFKGRFIIMFGKLWSACLHKKTVSSRKKMFWQLKILMVGLPRIGSFSHKSFETFVKVQNYIIGLFSGLTQAVLLVHVTPLFAFCTYIIIHFFSFRFMMSTTFLRN